MDYTGGRTKDTIIEWVNKKTGPPSLEVSCDDMQAKTAESKLAISYFGAFEGALWDSFMAGARNPAIAEKFAFFHTSDADCASKYSASAPGVALSRQFDESPLNFAGSSEEDLVNWAKGSSVPRLITFSEDYIEPIFGDRKSAAILFTEELDTDYQKVYSQAAKDLQGEILFVTSGVSEGIQSRLAEFIGVETADLPTLRIISPEDSMLKYVWNGDVSKLTADDVSQFIGDFKAGTLEPHLKSEAVPEQATVDGLTVVVGKSFDDVVKDPSKDVLVKYYAPWCGHCK
jgi:protein disulfide-isomerase A1